MVTLYLTGALLFSLGLDIYTYFYPQEVSISLKKHTKGLVLVSHMLGNLVCELDVGMWVEYMPKL